MAVHAIHKDGFRGIDFTAPICQLHGIAPNGPGDADRKSTRLNSSHLVISYAVFCLKKKKRSIIILGSYNRDTPISHEHPRRPYTPTRPTLHVMLLLTDNYPCSVHDCPLYHTR